MFCFCGWRCRWHAMRMAHHVRNFHRKIVCRLRCGVAEQYFGGDSDGRQGRQVEHRYVLLLENAARHEVRLFEEEDKSLLRLAAQRVANALEDSDLIAIHDADHYDL